jgi:GTPase
MKSKSNPRNWDRRTIARLITEVENYPEKARDIINGVLPYTGKAHVIGITGPPGCGKSTLIDKLALEIRKKEKKTVGIIAIDPTSHYSGGAFMGNRIRMREASNDNGIFIRSMASRGHLGGVSRATFDAIKILDASGIDYIIIETVGAGQIQTEIARTAYTVVVVLQPQVGDIVQAMKAGLMEIGDIFVVNKSDLPGADKSINDLLQMINMHHYVGWKPRIVRTVATKAKGISNLTCCIEEHRVHLESSGEIVNRKKEIARNEIEKIFEEHLKAAIRSKLEEFETENIIQDIVAGKISAYDVVKEFMPKGTKIKK